MTRKGCIWGWLIGVLALLVIFLVTVVTIESLLGQQLSLPSYGARVGLIRVEGGIYDARQTIADLEQMAGDPGIRAIVLRVESPGGGVAASQEIFEVHQGSPGGRTAARGVHGLRRRLGRLLHRVHGRQHRGQSGDPDREHRRHHVVHQPRGAVREARHGLRGHKERQVQGRGLHEQGDDRRREGPPSGDHRRHTRAVRGGGRRGQGNGGTTPSPRWRTGAYSRAVRPSKSGSWTSWARWRTP